MNHEFQLTIADIAFSVRTPPGVEIVEDQGCYSAFLGPPEDPAAADLFPLQLRFDEPPEMGRLVPVFDTGEAWRALRSGHDTILTIDAPTGYRGHLWAVHLTENGPPYDLFWARELVQHRDEKIVMVNPIRYPLDQILTMTFLAPKKGVIVHAAGFHREGVGAFFAGVSGAGKSTLTELLAGAPDLAPLSDDRVIVRRSVNGARVFGTPWPGEADVAANHHAKLGAMVILRQANQNGFRELSPGQALERLLPTVSILWYDEELTTAALAWIDELLREVPAYELSFRRDGGVAETVDELFSQLSA